MSNKISRWIGPALVVALAVFFMAISSAEAQIKFSQRGFVLMDYKVGINVSKADRDFSKKESIDLGTQRFRIWNNWKLGEYANAEWMVEIDSLLGVGGKFATPASNPFGATLLKSRQGSRAWTSPFRGPIGMSGVASSLFSPSFPCFKSGFLESRYTRPGVG